MKQRWFVLVYAAASGYISLSQEMVWMRAVAYMSGDRPWVFAHVLGFFLLGVAFGAFYGERFCERAVDRPGRSPIRFVGGMLLVSALVYYVSIPVVASLWLFVWPLGGIAVCAAVTLVAFMLGAVFPVLCHYGVRAGQEVGLAVSRVYMANIVGSTLGPLLTGFVFMQYLPTDRIVLYIAVGTFAVGGAAFLFDARRRAIAPIGVAVAGIALLLAAHGWAYDLLLEKLQFHGARTVPSAYKHVRQSRSGIIAVVPTDKPGQGDSIFGGGSYDGRFNVDPRARSNVIDRAYMIAGLHPNPESVLEIGLSGGSWARVLAAYEPVKRHTVVEINRDYLSLIALYEPQRDLLADPRLQIHIDDGRRWLNRHPDEKFDFILQNTTLHWRAQVTNLLSVEYLRLCKRHLKDGGVMYYNTTGSDEIARTAAQEFKYVVRYANFVAASDSPFLLKPETIAANLQRFVIRGRRVFDLQDPALREVAEKLANQTWRDVAPELRARRDKRVITDDNMASEYKSEPWRNPNRTWAALFRRWREK